MASLPRQGAAAAAAPPTSSPISARALQISKPPITLDSSDAAGTDTSASPLMNPERSLTATSSDTSAKGRDGGARGTSAPVSVSAPSTRRRKSASGDPTTAEESKPASASSGAKPQRKYERKTKRFIWPDELHRLFVAAIFDVGLKNASPKALLALMEAAGPNTGLTTEHLKSHLQKYRLNYERSRNEFLEYYDRSAKRNLKRRRRHAQHRSSGSGGEGNTMFVFPISNTKRRKGHGSDTDSDSDSEADGGNNDVNMGEEEEGARGHSSVGSTYSTPRGLPAGVAASAVTADAHTGSLSYSQLMQSTQQHKSAHTAGSSQELASAVLGSSSAAHQLPPAYSAAQMQRKQGPDHERALAAAAAAAAAYHYPIPRPGVCGGLAASAGMPELTDPQWSILTSLMSPQLSGMNGLGGDAAMLPATSAAPAAGEAMGRVMSSSDPFVLQENPSDLQMQMHLAMQAQMDLHRQMLTRKVEVSQHLARHGSMGSMDSRGGGSGSIQAAAASTGGYGGPWNEVQQQQQQQEQQRLQQQQLQKQEQQEQQQQQQQQANEVSRPSVSTLHALAAESQSLSPTEEQAAVATTTVSPAVPATNAAPVGASSSEAPSLAMVAGADSRMTGLAKTEVGASGLTMETKSDDDAMDLYRWDRIDLNVELDDDDLFGFLKS